MRPNTRGGRCRAPLLHPLAFNVFWAGSCPRPRPQCRGFCLWQTPLAMGTFAALDPQLQGAVVGGAIALIVFLLGGLGWIVRYWLQASDRRRDLRRMKMQHAMEKLIESHDWAVQREDAKASHPGDHILWL